MIVNLFNIKSFYNTMFIIGGKILKQKIIALFTNFYNKLIVIVYRHKIRRIIRKNKNINREMDKIYKRKIDDFWGKSIKKYWHLAYSSVNGIKDVRYIPEDVFYSKILPSLNNLELATAYSDKNSYEVYFDKIKLPEFILKNKHGYYFDNNNKRIDYDRAREILKEYNGFLIIKPSIESGSGRNVRLVEVKSGKILLENKQISFEDIVDMCMAK